MIKVQVSGHCYRRSINSDSYNRWLQMGVKCGIQTCADLFLYKELHTLFKSEGLFMSLWPYSG